MAIIDDLPAIVRIYNQAIASRSSTGDLRPYTIEERIDWYEGYSDDSYPIYVVLIGSKVMGYCTISPYRPGREAMAAVGEISIYLDSRVQKKGVGTQLLEFVITDCDRIGKKHLLAILLDLNKQSIRILEKFGFDKWGHFPRIVDMDGRRCGQLIFGLSIGTK